MHVLSVLAHRALQHETVSASDSFTARGADGQESKEENNMIYQFKTMDDELFAINTVELRWGRASSIVAAPTLAAAEQALSSFVFVEEGTLVPMGAGIYSMDGRTKDTVGPGAGL